MTQNRNRFNRGLFGSAPAAPTTSNFLNDLFRAVSLQSPSPPGQNALMDLLAQKPAALQLNTLGNIFGQGLAKRPIPFPEIRRKVFFSFHFEEDIRRSCVVRNSYRFRPGQKLPTANFYDRSLWESSKREGEASLKQLIREGMAGSSVTCVLAGTYTWQRRWVRYEIARSLVCRNGLFTVYIHNVKDPHRGTALAGYNPLDFVGLELRADGRGNIWELVAGGWQPYVMHRAPVAWPRWLAKPSVGYLFPLSHSARSYDYCLEDGYNRLAEWAQLAAHEGR